MEKYIEALIEKAAKEHSPIYAMQFSQAAVNAANALAQLDCIKRLNK